MILRGLTINSQGGTNGIVFNTGAKLYVESCVISGFSGVGMPPTFGIKSVGNGTLFVKDSIVRLSGDGILVAPSSGPRLPSSNK